MDPILYSLFKKTPRQVIFCLNTVFNITPVYNMAAVYPGQAAPKYTIHMFCLYTLFKMWFGVCSPFHSKWREGQSCSEMQGVLLAALTFGIQAAGVCVLKS